MAVSMVIRLQRALPEREHALHSMQAGHGVLIGGVLNESVSERAFKLGRLFASEATIGELKRAIPAVSQAA